MIKFYTILTATGKAQFANASITGSKVNFKEFAVGDSSGAYYDPSDNQTQLKNEVWRGTINQVSVSPDNPNWVVVEVGIPAGVGGFTIREAGIFDDLGNLLAIGKYPETYKPAIDSGSSKDLYVRMILEVSNASSVTLKVDPTVIFATRTDVIEIYSKISSHIDDLMPHQMLIDGVRHRYGFEQSNGFLKFKYEKVV